MIKFYIGYTDFDSHYQYHEDIVKEFKTTEEAINWCKSNKGRRDYYSIEDAYKDGKQYDWKTDALLLRYGGLDVGFMNAKEELISKLTQTIDQVKSATTIEELVALSEQKQYL